MPLRYPRIPKCAPLLSVPLGKPLYFDGEDYCMWSDKMRHHLTSLHENIWDIVEFGAQAPHVWDIYLSTKFTTIFEFKLRFKNKKEKKQKRNKKKRRECALGPILLQLAYHTRF
jgi:hypothetical protein